ncbi:MAG: Na(+)-translocating NADH-quinone reductase subunit A [Bacteroidales bacterium]|nr:Na(+)-translocating NADH-quinone reductase subunit A [Bacteroidales bacterium]MBQ8856095.1 Na(+)-translocating NADH-quinone reductase subunit A [Bacteroidales bacterium]
MSNNIYLKKGLDLPISGVAAQTTKKVIVPDVVAVKPTDFRGLVPKLLVREGDKVLAGTPVLADKMSQNILFASPVSGTVAEVVRGEKRKLLEVRIKADETQEYVDFGVKKVADMSAEQIKAAILEAGLWPAIMQRPYGIIANPEVQPKAIFVSAFTTAPLAANPEYALEADFEHIQTAINALNKLTAGGVHLSLNEENYSGTKFHKLENVIQHTFTGKHPAGNVGVQIHHISPIRKGETVWTVSLLMLAAIGKLFNTGKYDVRRKIAVTGPKAENPAYVEGYPGISMKDLKDFYASAENLRFVSGDVLTGTNVGAEGFLGFADNQVTILEEGNKYELLGWAKPVRCSQFSASRTYFSWLTPNRKYDMDTNLHGGPRAFVVNDVYSKVLPMDLYPVYLLKACLANDIDKMEKFGIYEVLEEDLALCEYVCPSKIYIQQIITDGIALMLKEMC